MDYRGLVKWLKENGYEVAPSRRNVHLGVYAEGKRIGTLPCSPSDNRSIHNDIAHLRRAGVDIPHKGGRR